MSASAGRTRGVLRAALFRVWRCWSTTDKSMLAINNLFPTKLFCRGPSGLQNSVMQFHFPEFGFSERRTTKSLSPERSLSPSPSRLSGGSTTRHVATLWHFPHKNTDESELNPSRRNVVTFLELGRTWSATMVSNYRVKLRSWYPCPNQPLSAIFCSGGKRLQTSQCTDKDQQHRPQDMFALWRLHLKGELELSLASQLWPLSVFNDLCKSMSRKRMGCILLHLRKFDNACIFTPSLEKQMHPTNPGINLDGSCLILFISKSLKEKKKTTVSGIYLTQPSSDLLERIQLIFQQLRATFYGQH